MLIKGNEKYITSEDFFLYKYIISKYLNNSHQQHMLRVAVNQLS